MNNFNLEYSLYEGFENNEASSTTSTTGDSSTTDAPATTSDTAADTTTDTTVDTTADTTADTTTDTTADTTADNAADTTTDNAADLSTEATNIDTSIDTTTPDDDTGEVNGSLNIILQYESLYVIFWIVAIYFIIYSFLAFFFKPDSLGYVYNVIILVSILVIVLIYKFFESNSDTKNDLHANVNQFLSFFDEKYNALYTFIGLVLIYTTTYALKIPTDVDNKPTIITGLETLLWILFILILFVQGFKEYMDISLTKELKKFLEIGEIKDEEEEKAKQEENEKLGTVPEVDSAIENEPGVATTNPDPTNTVDVELEDVDLKEVFNIGGNHYTYSDADAICKAYGAELADYEQIEGAYGRGGEWCNYGWSKDQMALFPTQKTTWDKLQDNVKTKNNCGRPGVNGGVMSNPALRFGVNCYGIKPDKRDFDYGPVTHANIKSQEDLAMDAKVNFWKTQKDKLKLNHYDSTRWSRY